MKKSVLRFAAFCVAASVTGASAEEMATPPSQFVTASMPLLAWTGLYFGINGGFAWNNPAVSYTANDPASVSGLCTAPGGLKCIPTSDFKRDGGLFGGQIGYNWQFNSHWLAGIEGDYQWADASGTGISPFKIGGVANTSMVAATEKVRGFGTLRARVGMLPIQSLLIYGTAGLAIGQVSENLNLVAAGTGGTTLSGYGYSCTTGNSCFVGSASQTRVGFAAGPGAEFAITSFLTLKVEGLYVHLGGPSAIATALNSGGAIPSSFTGNFSSVSFVAVRSGLNYRF